MVLRNLAHGNGYQLFLKRVRPFTAFCLDMYQRRQPFFRMQDVYAVFFSVFLQSGLHRRFLSPGRLRIPLSGSEGFSDSFLSEGPRLAAGGFPRPSSFYPGQDLGKFFYIYRFQNILRHIQLDGLLGILKIIKAGKRSVPSWTDISAGSVLSESVRP